MSSSGKISRADIQLKAKPFPTPMAPQVKTSLGRACSVVLWTTVAMTLSCQRCRSSEYRPWKEWSRVASAVMLKRSGDSHQRASQFGLVCCAKTFYHTSLLNISCKIQDMIRAWFNRCEAWNCAATPDWETGARSISENRKDSTSVSLLIFSCSFEMETKKEVM